MILSLLAPNSAILDAFPSLPCPPWALLGLCVVPSVHVVPGPVLGNLGSQPGADKFLLRRWKGRARWAGIIHARCRHKFTSQSL